MQYESLTPLLCCPIRDRLEKNIALLAQIPSGDLGTRSVPDRVDGVVNGSILTVAGFSRRSKPTIISKNCLVLDSKPYPFGIH